MRFKQLFGILIILAASFSTAQTVITAKSVNGVLNANQFSGSDIGAQLNTVFSQYSGGTVMVPDGTYNFSTTISPALASNAGYTIDCGSTHTILNYTGQGDAVYLAHTSGLQSSISIRNCTIVGSHAGGSANGIHIRAASGISLYNCVVAGFGGDGILQEGGVDTLIENVSSISNGINLLNTPDVSDEISTNAMKWIGGSLQYGTVTNYWEKPAPSGTSGFLRDAGNTVQATFEISGVIPQVIIEACDSCTIENSYMEYVGSTGSTPFPAMVIGNATNSGYGSETAQYPKHLRLANNLTYFPSNSIGYEIFNAKNVTLDDIDEQGGPQYVITFANSPTIGISGVNIIAGLPGWTIGPYQNPQSSYFGSFKPW